MVARGIVVTVALALLASGCTGDDQPAARRSSPATHVIAPKALEPSWTAELGPAATEVPRDELLAYRPHGQLDVWQTDEAVVVVGRRGVRAFDAATGAPRWTFTVPQRLGTVCAASADTGAAGVGGLLFSTGRVCDTAGVLDLGTGRLRWAAPLHAGRPDLDPGYADRPVHVGRRVLTVALPCDVRRYALADGRALPDPLPRDDRGCAREVAVGDGVLAWTDKATDTLTLVDAETGRRTGRSRLPKGGVDAVVSGAPLVLAVRPYQHRVIRRYDEGGRPGTYLGRQSSSPPKVVGVLDGVLVVSYSIGSLTDPLFRGYDATTGQQVWRGDGLYVAGEQAGKLLTLLRPLAATDAERTQVWVGRADAHDPVATQVALGRLPYDEDATYGWTDGFLVRRVGEQVDAYRLPDPAADGGARRMPDLPAPTARPAPEWKQTDVRPDDATDVCTQVRPSTLRSLGLRHVGLPVPSDCQWHEVLDDPDADRSVLVETVALAPAEGRTATETAHAALETRRAEDDNFPGPPQAVPGLGDEALRAERRTRHEVESRLTVRSGNVLVTVHVDVRVLSGEALPSVAAVRAGQQRVLDDVLAALAAPS